MSDDYWSKDFRKTVVETDSLLLVNMIKQGLVDQDLQSSLLAAIVKWLRMDWDINCVHTLREGNFCVDHLAGLGLILNLGLHVWEGPLPSILDTFFADRVGSFCPVG